MMAKNTNLSVFTFNQLESETDKTKDQGGLQKESMPSYILGKTLWVCSCEALVQELKAF